MKTIYKYPVPVGGGTLRLRGNVLSAGVQNDEIMVWAVHDTNEPERRVKVDVMGTGHPFLKTPEADFVGTVFMGQFVWHVFATAEVVV